LEDLRCWVTHWTDVFQSSFIFKLREIGGAPMHIKWFFISGASLDSQQHKLKVPLIYLNRKFKLKSSKTSDGNSSKIQKCIPLCQSDLCGAWNPRVLPRSSSNHIRNIPAFLWMQREKEKMRRTILLTTFIFVIVLGESPEFSRFHTV